MRQWVAVGTGNEAGDGSEVYYQEDLAPCCRGYAAGSEFECGSCGAFWEAVAVFEPEYDAFVSYEEPDHDSRGAA